MLFKPGRYTAQVIDHRIAETKKGDPQAWVKFAFKHNEEDHEISWYGSFNGKALEHTIKGLISCGLKGDHPAGPLELGKLVSIVIETKEDSEGKERSSVRWVNKLSAPPKAIEEKTAKALLQQYTSTVKALRMTEGEPNKATSTDDDDPPF